MNAPSYDPAHPARDLRPELDHDEARAETGAVVPSGRLLGGQRTLTIDHEGTRYVLRATRTGKLILTK